jgi:hypothetical protein
MLDALAGVGLTPWLGKIFSLHWLAFESHALAARN